MALALRMKIAVRFIKQRPRRPSKIIDMQEKKRIVSSNQQIQPHLTVCRFASTVAGSKRGTRHSSELGICIKLVQAAYPSSFLAGWEPDSNLVNLPRLVFYSG